MSLLIVADDVDHAAWRRALATRLPDLALAVGADQAGPAVRYLLCWQPPAALFARLPALAMVFSMGAGVDHLLRLPTLPTLPIVRLRDAGMGRQMAEYALYAALHYQRDFDHLRRAQSERRWAAQLSAPRPRLRVGVLGLGTLGRAVARALRAAGFPVAGWSRRARALDGVECYAGDDQLATFLGRSELLFCLLPDTAQTHGLLDARRLAQLPRGAALVNVARGPLVVIEALLGALDSGQLRGAMLDVFEHEPLAADSPLWSHPRITISPHIAAATVIDAAAEQIAAEIERERAGLAPLATIERRRGY